MTLRKGTLIVATVASLATGLSGCGASGTGHEASIRVAAPSTPSPSACASGNASPGTYAYYQYKRCALNVTATPEGATRSSQGPPLAAAAPTSCPSPVADRVFGDGPLALPDVAANFSSGASLSRRGQNYDLLGGFLRSDGTGVIALLEGPVDFCAASSQQGGTEPMLFHVPGNGGAVVFNGISGDVVAYQTSGGSSGNFDVVSRSFH